MTSTYVTTSVPSSDQFELTPNKKVYIQFDLPKITKTKEVAFVKSNKWPCHSVFYLFIRPDNCYPNLKCNPYTNDVQQYTAVVTYLKSNKFCVHPNSMLDFQVFVKHLCNLLWEMDLHYEKFKACQCAFSNIVERNFLKFKKPQSHGHKPKQSQHQSIS